MTDKEMLVALLEKMGLKPADRATGWDADTYEIEGDRIRINQGSGYEDHYVVFRFDPDGNILDHSVMSLP